MKWPDLSFDQRERARHAPALHRARLHAFAKGEYVGQESFMVASEIVALAGAAGVAPGALVLDLCCGRGGPALHVVTRTRCTIVGVDRSYGAVSAAVWSALTAGLTDRASFVAGDVTRLPLAGQFDVVLLLETMLAIEDKGALLGEIARVLRPGGRLGLTMEEGEPLSPAERTRVPEGDRIWLVSADEFLALARQSGFALQQVVDRTEAHACVVARLMAELQHDHAEITAEIGPELYAELVAAHAQWLEWLESRHVRKFAFVLERTD